MKFVFVTHDIKYIQENFDNITILQSRQTLNEKHYDYNNHIEKLKLKTHTRTHDTRDNSC